MLLRADSGFAREALMAWCKMNQVDFVFGLARNARLVEEISVELLQAKPEACAPFVHSALATTRRRRDQLSACVV
jgi:Transposase DDE domain group 1